MAFFFKVNDRTTEWLVRVLYQGEGYGQYVDGKWACTAESPEPLVEFYDLDCERAPFGAQFVNRYKLNTILEGKHGINLDDGTPKWTVTAEAMRRVRIWLSQAPWILGTDATNPAICLSVFVSGKNERGLPVVNRFDVVVPKSGYVDCLHIRKAEEIAKSFGMEGPLLVFEEADVGQLIAAGSQAVAHHLPY
jgi:hypothetical protein